MASTLISGGSTALNQTLDPFIIALRAQAVADRSTMAPASGLPARGIREWVNKMVKTWRFLSRWREHIIAAAPPSVQAAIVAVDVVMSVIEAMNLPGPE